MKSQTLLPFSTALYFRKTEPATVLLLPICTAANKSRIRATFFWLIGESLMQQHCHNRIYYWSKAKGMNNSYIHFCSTETTKKISDNIIEKHLSDIWLEKQTRHYN